ncbi:S8 family serine peptidase [Arthrobacter zhaoguopingii]|uniref:S8 family serine peptidase n=1 Tax=Arthrobacter zhaoguopingii TaxID=2681491 RepID=UPI00135B26E1|nr:S8 family serine peptidase [Arthrobacter zhaoguopingii]
MSILGSRSLTHLAGGTAALAVLAGGLTAVEGPPASAANKSQRVIIEFEGEHALARLGDATANALRKGTGNARSDAQSAYRSARAEVTGAQEGVLAEAGARGIRLEETRHVTGVLNAVIATVDPSQLEALRGIPGVARVNLDRQVHSLETAPAPEPADPAQDGEATTAPTAPAEKPTPPTDPAAPAPTPKATAKPSAKPAPKDAAKPAKSTQPDDADAPTTAETAAGKGSVVAVLDTGIDYSLPELGGGFGEGFKVVDGYDFVNDDDDPMDDHYHGTHVAGIVAGTGAAPGVAPEAALTAYKVLNEEGAGWESAIIAGIEAAADPLGERPADVINMSLGGPGDGNDALGDAASNATQSGVLVVAAAGNEGPGEATIGTPAAAADVLAVGASVTDYRVATAALAAPMQRTLTTWRAPFSANPPEQDLTAPVVAVGGAGTAEDFDAAGDVAGKVVAHQAELPRSATESAGGLLGIAQLAEERGAAAVIFYSPPPESDTPPVIGPGDPTGPGVDPGITDAAPSASGPLAQSSDSRLDSLVVLGMKNSEYAAFAEAVEEGTARITISSVDATDTIASFSSRGPTVRSRLKPEIVAPGLDILSMVPSTFGAPGNLARLSGTSMASPFVAGAAAIASAQHPDLDPASLRSLLVGSSKELAGASARLSPTLQGAGRADTGTLKKASVLASPSSLGFGQADARGDRPVPLEFALKNLSSEPVSARLEVLPSDRSAGELTLSSPEVSIAPGASVPVEAVASATVSEADSELSGVILARLSDGTEVRIPYLQLSRRLSVTATPQPAAPGTTRVLISSFLRLDETPVLTVSPNGGTDEPFTVTTVPSPSMPGWYSADVEARDVGAYTLTATGVTGGSQIAGSGSMEVVSGETSETTWKQVGRNASSDQLAVSPAAPGTAMQTTSTSVRPFITTDHGASWRQMRSLPVADGSGIPLADPKNGKAFWYAVNGGGTNPPMDPSYAGRLLRTEDLGKTWSVLPMPDKHVSAVVNDGSRLAVLTADGVEISLDGGATWSHLPFRWAGAVTGAALQNGNLLVAGTERVWRVEDVFGSPGTPDLVYESPDRSITGVAATGSVVAVSERDRVTTSTDGGSTWRTTEPLGSFAIDVHAVGDELIRATSNNGYARSTDNGVTWKDFTYPGGGGGIGSDFARWPDDRRSLLVAMETSGLYASRNDGDSFKRLGVAATTIKDVIASTDVKGAPRLFVSDDQGSASRELPAGRKLPANIVEWGPTGGEGMIGVRSDELEQDAGDRNALWRTRVDAWFAHRIEVSSDGGATWTQAGRSSRGQVIHDLEASPTTTAHGAGSYADFGDKGLLVTRDAWQTWETYQHPITIRNIAIDPSNDTRMWLAADEGLYLSEDDGATIRQVQEGETSTVWVDPVDPLHVVAGGRGISVSTDGGKSFTRSDVGGIDMYTSSITEAVVKGKRGHSTVLFAGSTTFRPTPLWVHGRGVLASLDGGLTWKNVSAGLASTSVTSLDASNDGKWLFVGTRQGGLFRADTAELIRAAG